MSSDRERISRPTAKGKKEMQKVNLNNIEKLDFRSKESYKTLRTNLEFAGKARKVVAVTSCTPNEGKTSISFRLALSMAESGKRVVLVDADLRKSVLRSLYRVSAARYGLSHYLSGQSSLSDVLYETNVPDFYAIFSGPVPPNPSELLGGEAFGLLLEYLRREYDYVVVDTPPLGSVIDGAVVAKQCDGAVLVIESGTVSYKFAQSVKDQLDKAGCSVLGVVLNKVNLSSNSYYGKYYGKYYGMYGADEDGGLEEVVTEQRFGNAKDEKARQERQKQKAKQEKSARSEKTELPERTEKTEHNGKTGHAGNGQKDKALNTGNNRNETTGASGNGADGQKEKMSVTSQAENDRGEKNAAPGKGNERAGRNQERDSRPSRRERKANRKAVQGKIMLLDEDEMDFVTLDEEILEEKTKSEQAEKSDRAEKPEDFEKG